MVHSFVLKTRPEFAHECESMSKGDLVSLIHVNFSWYVSSLFVSTHKTIPDKGPYPWNLRWDYIQVETMSKTEVFLIIHVDSRGSPSLWNVFVMKLRLGF